MQNEYKNLTATAISFDLGSLNMDFSNDNQGSNLVVMTVLSQDKWLTMPDSAWRNWVKPSETKTN